MTTDGAGPESFPGSKREQFINKASTADIVVRGNHGYANDVGDIRYLLALDLPIGQIAARMSRSPDAVARMLAHDDEE